MALGQYLSQSDDPDHKRFKPYYFLGGLPGTLDPVLWVYFLTGTFSNMPSLRPQAVMLPECSADPDLSYSMEGLLQSQSAQAAAQAEAMFEAFGAPRPVCPAGLGAGLTLLLAVQFQKSVLNVCEVPSTIHSAVPNISNHKCVCIGVRQCDGALAVSR